MDKNSFSYVFRLMICVCMITFAGCNNQSSAKEKPAHGKMESNNAEHAASETSATTETKSAINWQGTYKGSLPCASCEAMETELMLHKGNTFMLEIKYAGTKQIKTTSVDGSFVWIDSTTIKLQGVENMPSFYKVAAGRLKQLDMAGREIKGDSAAKYDLVKQ